jgi:osmotically-inducible protein OsmY
MNQSSLRRLAVRMVSVVCLAGSVLACAPLMMGGALLSGGLVVTDRRTSGAQLEDEGIEQRAASRLNDALVDRAHINITSYNRQVLLTGEVPTDADKTRAEQLVAGIDNVRGIINELAVLGNSTLGQRTSDTLVTGRVKASLVDAQDLYANAFKVVTERGVVYLMGRITQREAARGSEVVRSVPGVLKVVRVFEILTDEELQRMLPKPPPAKP